MARAKHATTRPSAATKGGGQFGFPVGSVVTITEASWITAGEGGESYLKGGREPDAPVLKLVGDVKGIDEPRDHVLAAGKSRGLVPSSDGEFLDNDPEKGDATSLTEGCNADVFFASLHDKKKQGKLAIPEELHDEGLTA